MWILPKNLHTSAFVPDTEALILDYNVLSEMSEQSLMSRSKPLRSRTWLQRWKKGILNQHLYGRILKPSHGGSFLAKWTSSLEASLANHSHAQEKGKAQTTRATSSPTSSQELALFDLRSFSSKTSKVSSVKNSEKAGTTQKEHPFCFMSLENWRGWVTEQRQYRRQRQKSVHLTNETDGSLLGWPVSNTSDVMNLLQNWPTIGAADAKTGYQNRNNGKKGTQKNLETVVRDGLQDQINRNTVGNPQESWLTPQTRDFRSGEAARFRGEKSNHSKNLNDQIAEAQNWSTPRVGGQESAKTRIARSKDLGLQGQVEILENWQTIEARNNKGYHVQSDGTKTLKLGSQVGQGKLNPRWVETLMGLPVGWCMPSCNELSDIDYTHDFYYKKNDSRIDELRLLGNGVVPATAELAFKLAVQSLFQLYQSAA